jgi:nucleoside diphosphate kinase
MSQQLAYVIITPYSLHKSRTGGILSRLITRTGLDLAGARMFAPGAELVRKYSDETISANDPQDRRIQELIYDYILRNLSPDPKTGRRRRVMMLLFKGEDAVRKTRSVIGNISADRRGGETIRDTYGDLIIDEENQVRYFEPAVLAAPTPEEAESKLKLWAHYSDTDGGVLENVIAYQPGEKYQRTLVLIKPENFRFPTGRPGNMIDLFSRTGLFIVGVKLHRMSVAQAVDFYGPVRETLRTKLKDVVAAKARSAVEKELGFKIGPEREQQLGNILGPLFGDNQFENIVRFMCGRAPSECPPGQESLPGSEKCIALVYEGVEAVRKIRDVLGPTDPSKAPPGSIRREFGQTVMVNAAHASDSEENARREMKIIGVGENNFRQIVQESYGAS